MAGPLIRVSPYGLLLVAGAARAIVDARPLQIPWSGLFVVAMFVLLRYGQRRNVLRAIELNRDPSDASEEG